MEWGNLNIPIKNRWLWSAIGFAIGLSVYSLAEKMCPSPTAARFFIAYGFSASSDFTCHQSYPWIKSLAKWAILLLPVALGVWAHNKNPKTKSGHRVRDSLSTEVILSLIGLVVVLNVISRFMAYNELRSGPRLSDPLLNSFEAVNVAWLTFTLLYASIITTGWSLLGNPKRLAIAMQSYALMLLLRMGAMSMVPLDPPSGIIVLNDPIIEFFGDQSVPLVKDLFFSGHTATMFILFFNIQNLIYKRIIFASAVAVALAVIAQHVHYTVDVIAAPFFAYGAYRFVIWAHALRRQS